MYKKQKTHNNNTTKYGYDNAIIKQNTLYNDVLEGYDRSKELKNTIIYYTKTQPRAKRKKQKKGFQPFRLDSGGTITLEGTNQFAKYRNENDN